jgi:hypothetical protein
MDERQIIDDILDEFDFDKVHKVMVLMNWKWVGETPPIQELRKTGRALFLDCMKNNLSLAATGGFVARREKIGKDFNYNLSFVLTEQGNYH